MRHLRCFTGFLIFIAVCLASSGCQSSGSAKSGESTMERVEVKPTTTTEKWTGPADQLIPLWPMIHPEGKK